MQMFQSEVMTGTGQDQVIPHNLGKKPELVIIHPCTTSFATQLPKNNSELIFQGSVDIKDALRKRDTWQTKCTSETITARVIAGKKYRVTVFA